MSSLPDSTVDSGRTGLTIRNQVTEIRRMSDWLDAALRRLGVPADLRFRFDLSANEAVTNIISYAYPDNGEHEISLQLSIGDAGISLQIEDDGTPFNLLSAPAHVRPASLEEAAIGGLGIDLIRKSIDQCDYTRSNGRNMLSLTAALPPPTRRD